MLKAKAAKTRRAQTLLLHFWHNGPKCRWHPDGTVENLSIHHPHLSDFEADCAHLRYDLGLEPKTIAQRTGRPHTAVNSALNRFRAKTGSRWLTFGQVRHHLDARGMTTR
jgi:hypothetical protein